MGGVRASDLVEVGRGLIESEHAEKVPADLFSAGAWTGGSGNRLNGFGGHRGSGGPWYSPGPAWSRGSVARGIFPTHRFVAGVGGMDRSVSEGDEVLNGLLDLNMMGSIGVLLLYAFEDAYEGLAQPIPDFFHVVYRDGNEDQDSNKSKEEGEGDNGDEYVWVHGFVSSQLAVGKQEGKLQANC